MQTIYLSQIELRIAAHVGKTRHAASRANGLNNAYGLHDDPQQQADISGAACEMAVAKLLNKYWSAGVGTFHAADVDREIQVRSTRHKNGRLILRIKDNPRHVYYLVIDNSPAFDVVGYVRGETIMTPQYLTSFGIDRPQCWAVPQERLHGV